MTGSYDAVANSFTLSDGQVLVNLHPANKCRSTACTIHAPTEHVMIDWPVFWDPSLGLLRECEEHGQLHPDPDGTFDIETYMEAFGCPCGCCLRTWTTFVIHDELAS